jgi:hypothetical protein
MLGLDDFRLMQLFDESTIDPYQQTECVRALEAVLATTDWALADVAALSQPFSLLVLARAGMVECHERGGFKKRLEVDAVLPWGNITDVAQTEPTLKVFGLDVTEQGGAVRSYKWSGDGSQRSFAERNRVYNTIAACMGI